MAETMLGLVRCRTSLSSALVLRAIIIPRGVLGGRVHFQQGRKLVSSAGEEEGSDGGKRSAGKEVTMAVSSLRIDTIAAGGLDISRKKVWEACLDSHVILNGEVVEKKSASVKEGDVIEVDTVLTGSEGTGEVLRRGRVVVKEIGERTRKGGYHVTLQRIKHYQLLKRCFSSCAHSPCVSFQKFYCC